MSNLQLLRLDDKTAELFFPGSTVTGNSLKYAARIGRLATTRFGKEDFTTAEWINDMVQSAKRQAVAKCEINRRKRKQQQVRADRGQPEAAAAAVARVEQAIAELRGA